MTRTVAMNEDTLREFNLDFDVSGKPPANRTANYRPPAQPANATATSPAPESTPAFTPDQFMAGLEGLANQVAGLRENQQHLHRTTVVLSAILTEHMDIDDNEFNARFHAHHDRLFPPPEEPEAPVTIQQLQNILTASQNETTQQMSHLINTMQQMMQMILMSNPAHAAAAAAEPPDQQDVGEDLPAEEPMPEGPIEAEEEEEIPESAKPRVGRNRAKDKSKD